MIHVTRRLTAKNRDQLRNPTLGNRVLATFTFTFLPVGGGVNKLMIGWWTDRDSDGGDRRLRGEQRRL